jgi:diguanylate cyclase (GGDEF)-like protein
MNTEQISSDGSNFLKSVILVVDDDRVVRIQLRLWLEAEGYRVVEAVDGATCLDVYTQQHPDLVLLDIILPDQDGLDCCQKIQNMSRATPILMMTGCDDEESITRAFALGAIDYVTKPIPWSILRHRLRRLLEESQRNRFLETENQQLMRLATLDSLTQIPNRRRFDEHFDAMWRQMVREDGWMALVMGDVDYFKPYNDTYGHPAGDQCLQQIADVLTQCCYRPLDLAARYGGEEFCIILPLTDLKGALKLSNRIADAIDALQIPHRGSLVGPIVTMSFGVAATRPQKDICSDLFLEATDEALYKAKKAGRHQSYGIEFSV